MENRSVIVGDSGSGKELTIKAKNRETFSVDRTVLYYDFGCRYMTLYICLN